MSWDRVQENWKKVSSTTKEALGSLARSGYEVLQGVSLTPQRIETNNSLRVEREKTDHAVAASEERVARHADAVVELARDNADAVLNVARENADAVLDKARDKADRLLPSGQGERSNTLAESQRIQRYAARMNRLIGDLTDVASIDAGKLALAPSLGDLAALLGEAEDSFKATASASGAGQPHLQFAQVHSRGRQNSHSWRAGRCRRSTVGCRYGYRHTRRRPRFRLRAILPGRAERSPRRVGAGPLHKPLHHRSARRAHLGGERARSRGQNCAYASPPRARRVSCVL